MRKIPVCLSSDDSYAPFVATTIASICYNTDEFVEVYVLDGGISPFHKRLISSLQSKFANFSLKFLAVDLERRFGKFSLGAERITLSTYSRFLIPDIIKDVGKIIYSDVDVIFLGDVAELYDQDLSTHSLGAISQAYFSNPQIKHLIDSIYSRIDLSREHRYLHAGVLLIDCNKWRSENAVEQLMNIAAEYRSRLTMADQCVLNIYHSINNYKLLEHKFCLLTQDCIYLSNCDKEKYNTLLSNVIVRHFESGKKPWLTDARHDGKPLENFNDFWFFAAMTPFYAGLQHSFYANQIKNSPLMHPSNGEKTMKSRADVKNRAIFAALRAKVNEASEPKRTK